MQQHKKKESLESGDIINLVSSHFAQLSAAFFEMQSSLMAGIIKKDSDLETSCIIMAFETKIHLEIIRQREKNLDHDISYKNFFSNLNLIDKLSNKVISISHITGIPKETVRRKIKKLVLINQLFENNKKEYCWCINKNQQNYYYKNIDKEIFLLSKLIFKFSDILNLNYTTLDIENEIKNNFSFYWFHFLSFRLKWMRIWQNELKDLDLLLIIIQAVIPTLKDIEKKIKNKKINLSDINALIGQTEPDTLKSHVSISTTSISDVSGIPRATCIRKLDKLVSLGIFVREVNTKRYYINQNTTARTKNVFTKTNVEYTLKILSNFLTIALNALRRA